MRLGPGTPLPKLNAALSADEPTQVPPDETAGINAQRTQRQYEQLLAAHSDQGCRSVAYDISNTTLYRTKGTFRTAVLDCFTRLPKLGNDLASSLTQKFHIIDSQNGS